MALLLFPVWALLISAVAWWFPEWFVGLKSWIIPLLILIMLGMGMTLKWQDFRQVWQYRKLVVFGVGLQFLLMPLAAWAIAGMMHLSTELTVGMLLVGATAGGTASNVMAYLAKGDVALSVSMTLVSTLAAVVLLPFMMWFYLEQRIDVPALSMLETLIKIIVIPIGLGMLLNQFFSKQVAALYGALSLFSMSAILLVIAIVVALNTDHLFNVAWGLLVAVILHNLIGLGSGYWLARKLGYNSVVARTVALEVGMQNSGLSVALALKYFTAASALPGVLFSVWHNISGAFFAAYWRQDVDKR